MLDPAFKAVARAMRPYLLELLDRIAFDAQCGGRKNLPLELPKTHVRIHLERLQSCKTSGSVLFLDGKHAYYSTVRNLLHTQGDFDDCDRLWNFVKVLHPDPDMRQNLFRELTKPGILHETNASPALCNYIRAAVDKTWFTLSVCSNSFYATTTGTSPGAPLADLLYQLISTRFLSHVHGALEKLGQATETKAGAVAPIPGWADDYAVLLEAPTAVLAVQQLQEVMPCVLSGLAAIGIELNLARGKTEALLVLNGVGCKKLRQELFSGPDPRLPFWLPSGAKKLVCLSHRYTHLGGTVSCRGGYKYDLQAVSREAGRVFSRLRKVLLWNDNLCVDERIQLFQSLVLSKMQQGAMTWFFHTKTETKLFQSSVDKWHRQLIGPLFGYTARGSTATEIQQALGVLSYQQLLDVAHVRWLAGIAPHCCEYLSTRLSEQTSWISQTKDAIRRLLHFCPRAGWSGVLGMDAARLIGWAKQNHTVLRNLAACFNKKVRRECLKQRPTILQSLQYRTKLFAAGGGFGKIPCLEASANVFCNVCGASFATRAACASHKQRRHAIAGAFAGVGGSLCMVCCIEFHSTQRLQLHLRKVKSCGACYLESDICFGASEAVAESGMEDKPAVCVPFARPFWAILRPSVRAVDVYRPVDVCVEVQCYRHISKCATFQALLGTVVAIRRQMPHAVGGLRMALCAIPFEMNEHQTGLIEDVLCRADVSSPSVYASGGLQLRIGFSVYCYGPESFPFHQLGVGL